MVAGKNIEEFGGKKWKRGNLIHIVVRVVGQYYW